MKIIAVANQKGGVGKTTTAVNLSACLAARGVRVLLLDLDPQGNASSSLGYQQEHGTSIYRVLLGEDTLTGKIQTTRFPSLSVIPGHTELASTEIDLIHADKDHTRLRDVLTPLRSADRFDYLIIDCPPTFGLLMSAALAAADGLLIPIQSEYFSLEGLSRILNIYDEIKASDPLALLQLEGILVTMHSPTTSHARMVHEEVMTHFSGLLYQTVIPRGIAVAVSQSHGKPLLEHDPKGKPALAYEALADEFLARQKQPVAPQT